MEEIIKLIETKPHFGKYYLIEERGKKEEMDIYVAYISAKNAPSGHVTLYDKEAYMFTFKTIYKSSKGYCVKIKGKTVYLEDFKED